MRFSLSSAGLQEWNGDVLAVGLPQGDVDATATALEQRFAGITDALQQQEFKGKPGDQLVFTPLGGGPQRLVVLGLGESDAIDTDRLRSAAAEASSAIVIGGGYIGLEVAATLAKSGKDVTVIEAAPRLLARVASPARRASPRRWRRTSPRPRSLSSCPR